MARTGNNYKKWLRGDNSINIQDRIMGTAHSLIVMCYLNANNSFKDICRTRYGRTDEVVTICFPLWVAY